MLPEFSISRKYTDRPFVPNPKQYYIGTARKLYKIFTENQGKVKAVCHIKSKQYYLYVDSESKLYNKHIRYDDKFYRFTSFMKLINDGVLILDVYNLAKPTDFDPKYYYVIKLSPKYFTSYNQYYEE